MRKKNLLLLNLLTGLILINALPANASIQDCDKDDVHCAYVTGLSDDLSNGRYIKMQTKQQTIIDCANNTETMAIMQEDGAQFIGQNTMSFYICKDKQGHDCQLVGTDIFNVTKDGSQYVSQPATYEINLKDMQGSFPQCLPDQGIKYKFKQIYS